jgi:tetratricopeptide (TPR) repeat protein
MPAKTKKAKLSKEVDNKAMKKRRPPIEKSYLAALREFWEGRPMTSIERLSKLLVDDSVTRVTTLKLYRLWIEILAEQKSTSDLKSLAEHLAVRALNDAASSAEFYALRGMIHFELDEYDAANLILSSIKVYDNPYVAELQGVLATRTSTSFAMEELWAKRDEIIDYFHMATLAHHFASLNEGLKLDWILERIKSCYQESPLPDFFKYHQLLSAGQAHKACGVIGKLVDRFPGNTEYRFHAGYAAAKSGDYVAAVENLSVAASLTENSDPDILNWLGFSLSELAFSENNRHNLEEARNVLQASIHLSMQLGIPTMFPSQQIVKINNALGDADQRSDKGSRIWMVKLSNSKYLELKSSHEEKIRSINKAMGEDPRPGDLCLLVGEDYAEDGVSRLRLGAIYNVASDPIWHPVYNYQSVMTLVCRPEVSVPFEVEAMQDENRVEPVYELGVAALGIIEQSASELLGENNPITHAFRECK